ncbi:unnamed protein product [Peronospora effusa]|nr:unnamed protein product [Peronospora effusa]
MPHLTPSSARRTLTSQDVSGPNPKKRHRDIDTFDAAPKPLNPRDEATDEVTLVVSKFCSAARREMSNTFRIRFGQTSTNSTMRSPITETTSEMQTSAEKFRVELAPGEVWALEPTMEEKRKCFKVASAIVKVVEVLAIDATKLTVDNVIRKQSHRLISHAHEPASNTVAKWCPSKDTFQSCDLVGTVVESFYCIVVYSRSQIDCLVKLAAAGLSIRQISSTMQSFRSHAPFLLCDLVDSKELGSKNVAAAVDIDFQGARNASPQYTEEQTTEFVRLIIAANLNVTSRLLHGCWAFSLVLRASMEHAPMRSYLEFRVKVNGQGAMHNVHLVSIPAFENKCKSMMYVTLEQVLNAVLPNWRHYLIGVATEGDAQMPARVLDIVARLQTEAAAPVVYRSTSSCHQLNCIVTNFYSSLQDGCFLSGLKKLSLYIRQQPELLA